MSCPTKGDGTTIAENTIERSHVEHGIYISGAGKQVTVSKNVIRDTHINGIHVNGVVAAPVISDNKLERIGSFPTKEGGAALTLIGGTSAPVVSGNSFKNHLRAGHHRGRAQCRDPQQYL